MLQSAAETRAGGVVNRNAVANMVKDFMWTIVEALGPVEENVGVEWLMDERKRVRAR